MHLDWSKQLCKHKSSALRMQLAIGSIASCIDLAYAGPHLRNCDKLFELVANLDLTSWHAVCCPSNTRNLRIASLLLYSCKNTEAYVPLRHDSRRGRCADHCASGDQAGAAQDRSRHPGGPQEADPEVLAPRPLRTSLLRRDHAAQRDPAPSGAQEGAEMG